MPHHLFTQKGLATVKAKQKENRDLGACPLKIFLDHTFYNIRKCHFGIWESIALILCYSSLNENYTLMWKQIVNMLCWPIILASNACTPMLETRPHASALRERLFKLDCALGFVYATLRYQYCPAQGCNCSVNCSLLSVRGVTPLRPIRIYAPANGLWIFFCRLTNGRNSVESSLVWLFLKSSDPHCHAF